jgi:hypothetical protein
VDCARGFVAEDHGGGEDEVSYAAFEPVVDLARALAGGWGRRGRWVWRIG